MSINYEATPVENAPVLIDSPVGTGNFGGSRRLFQAAASEFGVCLSDEEYYDWLVKLEAAMVIDQLIDEEKLDIRQPFAAIVSGNFRDDIKQAPQIRAMNFMNRQDDATRQDIFNQVAEVNELAIRQRGATKAREVVDITMREADILASLLALSESGVDSDSRKVFNKWLGGWARAGYALDTLVDRKEDFANGESGVEPTIAVASYYAMVTSREAVSALRKTPMRLIGRCGLNGFNYVIRQKRVDLRFDNNANVT